MIETFKNAWKIPELRKKILFTLLMLLVYRIGCAIPVPGVDVEAIKTLSSSNTFFGLFDVLTGGAFSEFAIFALGISPYINASIIIQLLTMVIPALERMSKEGETGRQQIAQITRYATLALSMLMAIGFTVGMSSALNDTSFFSYFFIVMTLAAGSMLLMWVGERMTEKGIGNGISMLIFISIVSRMVPSAESIIKNIGMGTLKWWIIPIIVIGIIFLFASVVFMDKGERKIQVSYAQRVVGRKVYGGQSTHIPMKMNPSGVMPIIFAVSIVTLPQMIATWVPSSGFAQFTAKYLSSTSIFYLITYGLLIVFFAYFYTTVSFNPVEVSKNLKERGGYVLGIRPGKPTSDYLSKILNRLTLVGSLFLTFIAILPIILGMIIPALGNAAIGGSSIIILVNVALETTSQMESQMLMRHYKGFLKG